MKKILSRCWLMISLPCVLNLVLLLERMNVRGILHPLSGFLITVILLGNYLRLLLLPAADRVKTSLRARIMIGGGRLIYCGLYAMAVQAVLFFRFYLVRGWAQPPKAAVLAVNSVLACAGCFLLLAAGVLRIICTSKRLGIVRRLVMALTMWIPLLNLPVLLYVCRLVYEEYDHEREKTLLRTLRVDSDLCRTKYPQLLVHGIGFRDLRYFNYWGRSPGLDARYTISALRMGPYVASLTTMNTPHRGCRFVDYACRLPDGLYRLTASCFDRAFSKLGDRHPDFYTATRQFSTAESRRFNEQIPDVSQVYYQSYTSKMKHPWSHLLLAVPYCMILPLEGENDGLVSVDSARWGDFRGVFSNTRTRGISHGDMIDLKREDYAGFDVVETYVQIVSELKNKGF